MHPRLHRVLRLTFAATLALTFSHVHAIPKAAENADGTVEIVADVPRPKAAALLFFLADAADCFAAGLGTLAAATSAKKPARGKK